ncbi:MAG: hypothetical protein V4733_03450 [Verrucomicrobiota bacterium]
MPAKRKSSQSSKGSANSRRGRLTFRDAFLAADARVRDTTNRRAGKRAARSIRAMTGPMADEAMEFDFTFLKRISSWLTALILLPLCWITSWTLLSRFLTAAENENFWKGEPFWYFTVGALLMGGWFFSGLGQRVFLYFYVLGHELTHVAFVKLFRGRVSDFHVSSEGGYITTNKTNLLIALSPYFVPFWAVVGFAIYFGLSHAFVLPPWSVLVFHGVMGAAWTFQILWTVWMLPRDQPDLRENGTFFSLTVIYLANVSILAAIFCFTDAEPLHSGGEFIREWVRHAATGGNALWTISEEWWLVLKTRAKL